MDCETKDFHIAGNLRVNILFNSMNHSVAIFGKSPVEAYLQKRQCLEKSFDGSAVI